MRLGTRSIVTVAALATVAVVGCNAPKDQTGNLKTAINHYYDQWPECLWKQPIQLPQQHAQDDTDKVRPFDALVDQGLLSRTPVEKTKLLVIKQAANSYDLTDKGRSNWTPDANNPGYGNFCYAHRRVKDILSNTPSGTQPGATTTVSYTYTLGDVKDWARATETQNAFPNLATALAATNQATTTLVLTNDGWKVQASVIPNSTPKGVGGDGGVVQ
ncbi:hypothetical protein [Terriglobus sp. ADX1]|uniref:hypothetical protein n=1 Tax=Terriglobus sp. ADX1 TaxID=2794063 RepID=UPI002FE55984